MRFAALALLALPALAMAAPSSKRENWGKEKEHDDMHDHKEYDDHHEDKHHEKELVKGVFHFTSTYTAWAGPDQVINNSQVAVPGEPGAYGVYKFGINADEDLICYNISVYISGDYQSPAVTATHIHEAVRGRAGPPRIAFPNPTGDSPLTEQGWRTSYGCLQGPFETGVLANGTDTAEGFTLAQIEANPAGFFADVHTVAFPAGAIRGQIQLDESAY
ncbi:hypothetical protein FFLO_05695 [Filobasidium floriforme]|uniref:CHRD domain-containing protein n=1 Tax=Filobasidium floriforme TaxID=5210 RepID=A0A8K0NNQ4_9TREE|nr:uncharacterized protein HD553DRAFT_277348 [Filobasidium floriforme]KAG7529380.1 hypothetical protein FFLO_05695 [Filobasidium floriforme]KAH8079385.1 hypothetical protein HD553DRAFT_277348 [Filobasidium floriforme]